MQILVYLPRLLRRQQPALINPGKPSSHLLSTCFGSPVGVSITVDLPRMPTETEWNALVVDLRTTFNAQGALHQAGDFRQWTNGNLKIFLEPMGEGSRLRMTTKNASGVSGLWAGPVYIGMALFMVLLVFVAAKFEPFILGFSGIIALAGILVHAYYRMKMLGWSEARQAQMQGVGDRMLGRMTDNDVETTHANVAEKPAAAVKQKSAGTSDDVPAPQIDLDEANEPEPPATKHVASWFTNPVALLNAYESNAAAAWSTNQIKLPSNGSTSPEGQTVISEACSIAQHKPGALSGPATRKKMLRALLMAG